MKYIKTFLFILVALFSTHFLISVNILGIPTVEAIELPDLIFELDTSFPIISPYKIDEKGQLMYDTRVPRVMEYSRGGVSGQIINKGKFAASAPIYGLMQVASQADGNGKIVTLNHEYFDFTTNTNVYPNVRPFLEYTNINGSVIKTINPGGKEGYFSGRIYFFPEMNTVQSVRICTDMREIVSDNNIGGNVAESDEGNNCSAWFNILVIPDIPDVAVPNPDTISVSISATPSGPLTALGATNLTWTTTGNPTSCDASGVEWKGKNIKNGDTVTQRSGMPAHTYVFGITCHKAGVADATDTVTVTVIVKPPTPTGNLSLDKTTCIINTTGSTCDVKVTWTTANLVAGKPTEVTRNNPDRTSVSKAPAGTSVTNTVNYGLTKFYLYHNDVQLVPLLPNGTDISVTTSCDTAKGYTWDPGSQKCKTTPPTPSYWEWPTKCPTACNTNSSTQTQTCTGGNELCSGPAKTRTCDKTEQCPIKCLPSQNLISGKCVNKITVKEI